MKALLLSVVLVFSVGCSCTLERKALDQLETNMKLQQRDHLSLMGNRDDATKDDWKKHYESNFRLIESLKKSTD